MKHSNSKVIKYTYLIITLLRVIINQKMSETIIIDDEGYLTNIEEAVILTLDGAILIDNPIITNIISVDSSNKLKLKGVTNWFQLVGILMTFRIKKEDMDSLINDNQWFNKICEYLNADNIINSELIAHAVITYLNMHMFVPIP